MMDNLTANFGIMLCPQYPLLLGRGACKRVYRGFDCEDGLEVAWNQVGRGAMRRKDGGRCGCGAMQWCTRGGQLQHAPPSTACISV